MIKSRVFGWIPDLPDHRDIRYSSVYRIPKKLPLKTDLRLLCPPIEDQGELGSCTAHALTGALEVLEKRNGRPVIQFSRLFVYYNERAIEHTITQDSGAMLRDGIKSLVKKGACSEKKWPYIPARYSVKPGTACFKEGLDHQITAYQRIDTVDQMRACLADGFPFVFGFTVYESFQSQTVSRTGKVRMPERSERVLGGHAVLGVGYNDAQKRFIVRNSWGTAWGIKGYFTIPYAYCASRDLSDDFWTIRGGELM